LGIQEKKPQYSLLKLYCGFDSSAPASTAGALIYNFSTDIISDRLVKENTHAKPENFSNYFAGSDGAGSGFCLWAGPMEFILAAGDWENSAVCAPKSMEYLYGTSVDGYPAAILFLLDGFTSFPSQMDRMDIPAGRLVYQFLSCLILDSNWSIFVPPGFGLDLFSFLIQ
jgi:hypothetical protein